MSESTLPFPTTAATPPATRAAGWRLRPFGDRAADLELDLAGVDAACDVLHACIEGAAPAREELAELSLGDRIAALLTLARSVDERPLESTMRCGSCGVQLETLLSPDELVAYHARASADGCARAKLDDGSELLLRLPTVRDFESWRERAAGVEELARDLTLDGRALPSPLPAAWAAAIERALGDADPLVDFRLAIDCPDCGAHGRYPLDLEALALERLRRAHGELLVTVHRLASAYHWSEREILSLPAARRRIYLSMIEAGQ